MTDTRSRLATFLANPTALPLLIVFAGAAAYANSLGGAFVFDDILHIVQDPSIEKLWQPDELFGRFRRPVLKASLALSYAISGRSPSGFRMANIAIHILAALTLMGIVRRTLERPCLQRFDGASASLLAAGAAVVWLVHPLNTQAVTYVIQRTESLMGLFYLLTLYCVIRTAEGTSHRRWGMLAVVCCALGMGTKEVMVTAPLVALLYDRTFLAGSFTEAIRRRATLYTGLAATWAVLYLSIGGGSLFRAGTTSGFGARQTTPWAYLVSQPGVILHYLRLALWPAPLCFDYEWAQADGVGQIVPSLLIVTVLLTATLLAVRFRPSTGFVGAAFFLVLAPTSSVMPIQDLAVEHRMYLPLAALTALAVTAVYRVAASVPSWSSSWSVAVLVLAVASLATATGLRNRQYQSEVSIWQSALKVVPQNATAHYNLGVAFAKSGQHGTAKQHYLRALDLAPDFGLAHHSLGLALAAENHHAAAIKKYERAVDLMPKPADALNSWGLSLKALGQPRKAIERYRQALKLDPASATVHNNLGSALQELGELDAAIWHHEQAIALRPELAGAYNNLGNALQRQNQHESAIENYRQALSLNPNLPETHRNLAIALTRTGKKDEAIAHLREVARLKPDDARAHFDLGMLLQDSGQPDASIQHLQRGVELQPTSAEFHFTLAHALQRNGRIKDAVAHYRRAVELQPNAPLLLNALAWPLATHPNAAVRKPQEAVQLAERAAEMTENKSAVILDTLATAYAGAGQFDQAQATAEAAVVLAEQSGDEKLLGEIRQRMELFRKSLPYVGSADTPM